MRDEALVAVSRYHSALVLVGDELSIEGVHSEVLESTTMPLPPAITKALPAEPAPQGVGSSIATPATTFPSPSRTPTTTRIVLLIGEKFARM
ncbi:hypothetical protein HAX54_045015, partial [Datura stramonium]|nr:hypothetical protein [Datura stramonium]